MRRIVLVLLVLCAVFALSCGDSGSASSPPVDAEIVSFTTDDGVTLRGHLFGEGEQGIVLAHMYPADQTSWFDAATRLAGEGYLVLTFDFRGYGESDGSKDIEYLNKDVMGAIQALQSAGCTDLMLVGASMGGTACLVAAEASQVFSSFRVAGVITLSAPVEFRGLSAEEAVPHLYMPLLLIAAEDDSGADGARRLHELATGSTDLELVPGDEHGTELLEGPSADEVWSLMLKFLREKLPALDR